MTTATIGVAPRRSKPDMKQHRWDETDFWILLWTLSHLASLAH